MLCMPVDRSSTTYRKSQRYICEQIVWLLFAFLFVKSLIGALVVALSAILVCASKFVDDAWNAAARLMMWCLWVAAYSAGG